MIRFCKRLRNEIEIMYVQNARSDKMRCIVLDKCMQFS